MSSPFPLPPLELASRIGGGYDEYAVIGEAHRKHIDSLLPRDWSFVGTRVLDFGCGTGRTLVAYAPEAARAEFWGCDIHQPSVEWAQQHLSPPFRFFTCREAPPLDQPDGRFDLVYAMSVFTHLTDQWSDWIAELHRVMRAGAVAIVSVLGPAMARTILGREWDERIGMAAVDLHKGWEIGGPSVLLADWWIREHWGRAFEVLKIEPFAGGVSEGGHGFAVLRRRETAVSPASLRAVDPADSREYQAVVANVELLAEQLVRLGRENRSRESEIVDRATLAAERDDLAAERDRLVEQLASVHTSTDGSGSGLLRRAASIVRR